MRKKQSKIKTFKTALSTRKVMQGLPPIKEIHYISDEELSQLQDCFLEMLKDIDRVCEENNICYMAAGGTCLGSVRHKGFIPWDDDVDLIMPRKDLQKFLRIFPKVMGEKYELTSPGSKYPLESMITAIYKKNTYKGCLQTLGTNLPQGVHIDIFSIENIPANPIHRKIKGLYAMGMQYIAVSTLFKYLTNKTKRDFFYQTEEGRINYKIRMFVAKVFSFRSCDKWARSFEKAVRYKKDSGLWGVPTDIKHYFGHVMPKDVYFPPIKGQFEDMMINLPHNTDEYLKNQYGDYMTIPKEADREKHWSIGFNLESGEKK